jgi:hypothetical protein
VELTMTVLPTPESMNRTAKLFMDRNEVADYAEALAKLEGFRLAVACGPEVLVSAAHQSALLTLVNAGRRTFLGGIFVELPGDAPVLVPHVIAPSLGSAVIALGGRTEIVSSDVPRIVIGSAHAPAARPSWQLTWDGWRGGVIPCREHSRLPERGNMALAPILAGAIALSEAFQYFDKRFMAGKRATGLSLWQPGADWRQEDPAESKICYLPRSLWLLGLGNLGQAYLWLLGALPYPDGQKPDFVLQDFDFISTANDSTSLLSSSVLIGHRKARAMAAWAEALGCKTAIVERRYGSWTKRIDDEPTVALCGFDNVLARAALEDAGFDLVVEAGLGSGVGAFMNFAMHAFPATRRARDIWKQDDEVQSSSLSTARAYADLLEQGAIDDCGLALLQSRSVGVPFVGLTAAAFVVAELLRRLHGGRAFEVLAGSLLDLDSIDAVEQQTSAFPGAYATLESSD